MNSQTMPPPTDVASSMTQKPRFRGVLHQFGAVVATGAGLVLVSVAPSGRASVAVAVFASSLVILFAVSATYHRIHWSARGRTWMRRADHAAIFVLIAGTYTPIVLLGLPAETGNRLLLAVWVVAVLGVLQSLFWVQAPKALVALLAVAAGWTIVPYIGDVRRAYGDEIFALILTGGIVYSIGAIAYAFKRPVLWPAVFGYHEVFHALTLLGAVLHFAAVLGIVGSLGS